MLKNLALLLLAVVAFGAAATEVVTVTLPDPHIKEHISSIAGPERKISVVLTRYGISETKRLLVSVQGPIENADAQTLVQSVLARNDGFWSGSASWDVSVVGDMKYASVVSSMYCGMLCGAGETYTYGRSAGGWAYLYRSDEWIS